MRKLLLLAVSLLLTVTTIYAERVSQEDAALVATNFMRYGAPQSGVRKATGAKMVLKKAASATSQNQYYVYENANGEGWVMVAANDVARPIIAYSETGTFKTDNQPANVKAWLSAIDKKIIFAEQNNIEATEEVSQEWLNLKNGISPKNATVVVAPLITTTWDQDEPYNLYAPGTGTAGKGSNKAYTGCVATAMAQVMNYWKWPEQGNGSHSYQPVMDMWDDDGNYTGQIIVYENTTLSANFGSTTYDWANMKKKHDTSDTQAQKRAIGTLMFHCGVGVEMQYGGYEYDGSGAVTGNYQSDDDVCAQNALWKYFRYRKNGLVSYKRDGYKDSGTTYYTAWNDADWTAMVKEELDKQHPIMYDGSGSGGHSFICDGYDSKDYFHFNWGWSGSNDGWYKLSNLVPGSGGAGGGSYTFTEDQGVIIGIVPDKTFADVTITWSVQGTTTTSTFKEQDPLVLPTNPADCSADKVFVGWTESSSVTGDKPADLFTSATGKVVTTAKTYYAVFATKSGSGSAPSQVASVTFTTASSDASQDISDKIATTIVESDSGISSYSGSKVYKGKSGAKLGTSSATGYITMTLNSEVAVTKVIVNAVKYGSDNGNLKVTAGETELGTLAPGSNLEFEAASPVTTNMIKVETTNKRAYIASISVIAGGGASYSNYSTSCGEAPQTCQLVGITLNTQNVKTSFFKGDAFTSAGLVVTAAYSNCANKVVTPTNVSTPDMSTVGTKTVTVTYTENAVTKTKDYSITVAEKPVVVTYTVKWHSCDGVKEVVYNKGDALVFPTTPAPNGRKTFYGWITDEHYTGATAPTIISAGTPVNDDADYYAVYE